MQKGLDIHRIMFRRSGIRFWRFSVGLYEICAFAIIVLATSVRILLIYQGWPQTDSDEGTMGLMALHIAYHGEYPIFFYGQGFMGSLEAYLAAAFFHLFGPSLFALRFGVCILFACFLVTLYFLTNLLYTKRLALVTLVLVGLGSKEMLFRQLEAAGGYPETLLFGVLLLLYASWLALSSDQSPATQRPRWRVMAYGGWGFVAGLALWSNPLLIPFIVMAGWLLLRFCRGELNRSVVLCIVLGVMIPILPMIIYNFTVPVDRGSFAVLGAAIWLRGKTFVFASPFMRIAGTVLVSLPVATGGTSLCPILPEDAWPLSRQSSLQTIQCTVVHGAWGLGVIVLWGVAAVLALRYYWKVRLSSAAASWPAEERQVAIRQFARLMLLGSFGLTLVLYALSSPAGLVPWPASRYLIGVLIAVPALLSPLWGTVRWQSGRFATVMMVLRYGVLLLVVATFLLGTIDTFRQISSVQARTQQEFALVHDLERIGATRIYSDYWTCDRIMFQSREQVICSVVDEQLEPGLDRYLPYRAMVASDPHPAYAFPVDSAQAVAFAHSVRGSAGRSYQRFVFDGYVVYVPWLSAAVT